MGKRIFLAGASGVIGRRLLPQLIQAGHQVYGMTRSAERARELEILGVSARVVDVFDPAALTSAVHEAEPEVIVHQLTDLSLLATDPERAALAIERNARIRAEGSRNLVQAALAAEAQHMIAQSIAWAYASGPTPHGEEDPLDRDAPEPRSTTVSGVIALEDQVLRTPGLNGTVLRYGQLYGPNTTSSTPTGPFPVHVDAAARAALLALDRAAEGVFNIAEPNDAITTRKAEAILGWHDTYRLTSEPCGRGGSQAI